MRIGIRFHDNDFWRTWEGIMRAFLDTCDPDDLDKDKIVKICNELSYGMYRLCQNRWRHGNDEDEERTRKHLKIEVRHVLLNEEIDELLAKEPWQNAEFFYVDFDNQQVGHI